MKKFLVLVCVSIALVLACSSSTSDSEDLWEPVEEQYKTIQVPIINDITTLKGDQQ
jgi:hypothetical protein